MPSRVLRARPQWRRGPHIFPHKSLCSSDIENKLMDMAAEVVWGMKERVGYMERVTWKHTVPYVKYIANGDLWYDSRNSNEGSVTA